MACIAVHAQTPAAELATDRAALVDKAEARGSLPVIVVLSSTVAAEHTLSSEDAVAVQRAQVRVQQDEFIATMTGYDAASLHRYLTFPAMALVASPDLVRRLVVDDRVLSVTENTLARPMLTESTLITGARAALDSGYFGQRATVAVLDAGFQTWHPFLSDRFVSEACYSHPVGGVGTYSLCPGGTGRRAARATLPSSPFSHPCSRSRAFQTAGISFACAPQTRWASVRLRRRLV